jgi:hypothetical protein
LLPGGCFHSSRYLLLLGECFYSSCYLLLPNNIITQPAIACCLLSELIIHHYRLLHGVLLLELLSVVTRSVSTRAVICCYLECYYSSCYLLLLGECFTLAAICCYPERVIFQGVIRCYQTIITQSAVACCLLSELIIHRFRCSLSLAEFIPHATYPLPPKLSFVIPRPPPYPYLLY